VELVAVTDRRFDANIGMRGWVLCAPDTSIDGPYVKCCCPGNPNHQMWIVSLPDTGGMSFDQEEEECTRANIALGCFHDFNLRRIPDDELPEGIRSTQRVSELLGIGDLANAYRRHLANKL
jgi:hypothetical protein